MKTISRTIDKNKKFKLEGGLDPPLIKRYLGLEGKYAVGLIRHFSLSVPAVSTDTLPSSKLA